MKKILLIISLLFLFSSVSESQVFERQILSTTDSSFTTEWIPFSGRSANHVEIYLSITDTVHYKYFIDYRFGALTETGIAVDSIYTTGTAATGLGEGVVLRGFGLDEITNKIPGANSIRIRGYKLEGFKAGSRITIGLLLR